MADYTNYNQGSSNKGAIAGLLVLGALIVGLFMLAANAPTVQDGGVPAAVETAPAATETAPAASDGIAPTVSE